MEANKDYRNLYVKCNVFMLADVFEKIRISCLKNYALYPSHYLSKPGLSWDAMLSMTKVLIC